MILVEHDMMMVMDISNHVVVLDAGDADCERTPAEIRRNPAVIKAYLGGEVVCAATRDAAGADRAIPCWRRSS